MNTESTVPVPPPGCPAHATGEPVPLHGAEFAADPQAYYEYMRHYGPTAPVELAPGVEATLVTDYSAALQLLQNAGAFRKDSRRWRDFNEGEISPTVRCFRFSCTGPTPCSVTGPTTCGCGRPSRTASRVSIRIG